jgi:hypothetical protein
LQVRSEKKNIGKHNSADENGDRSNSGVLNTTGTVSQNQSVKSSVVSFADKLKKLPNNVKKTVSTDKSTTKVIIGTRPCSDSSLKTSLQPNSEQFDNKAWLFLSRISVEENPGSVLKFLHDQGLKDVNCFELKTKFNTYKSFKIGLPTDLMENALDANFWPSGALIRPFDVSKPMARHSFLGPMRQKTKSR